jgi:hypothetical protein
MSASAREHTAARDGGVRSASATATYEQFSASGAGRGCARSRRALAAVRASTGALRRRRRSRRVVVLMPLRRGLARRRAGGCGRPCRRHRLRSSSRRRRRGLRRCAARVGGGYACRCCVRVASGGARALRISVGARRGDRRGGPRRRAGAMRAGGDGSRRRRPTLCLPVRFAGLGRPIGMIGLGRFAWRLRRRSGRLRDIGQTGARRSGVTARGRGRGRRRRRCVRKLRRGTGCASRISGALRGGGLSVTASSRRTHRRDSHRRRFRARRRRLGGRDGRHPARRGGQRVLSGDRNAAGACHESDGNRDLCRRAGCGSRREAGRAGASPEHAQRRERQARQRLCESSVTSPHAVAGAVQCRGDGLQRDSELVGNLLVAVPAHLPEIDRGPLHGRQQRDRGADLTSLLSGRRDLFDRASGRWNGLDHVVAGDEPHLAAPAGVDEEVLSHGGQPGSPLLIPPRRGWMLVSAQEGRRGDLLGVLLGGSQTPRIALQRRAVRAHQAIERRIVEHRSMCESRGLHTCPR